MTSMKADALRYAENRIPVFPVHTPEPTVDDEGEITGSVCSCGNAECANVGKHPRIEKGFKGATIDAEKIVRWWDKWPDANIGMPTGKASRYVVVDADDKDAMHKIGEFPATVAAKTGRGIHAYYKAPSRHVPNSASKVAPGLDIRGDGGYVLLPPSTHKSGNSYKWNDLDIVDGEAAELTEDQVKQIANANDSGEIGRAENVPDQIIKSARNTTLTSLAGTARDRGSTAKEIYAYIGAVNKARCKPPLEDDEVWGIARGIESRYAPKNEPDYNRVVGLSGRRNVAEAIEQGVKPPDQIIPGFMYAAGIHSIFGPPGTGKSIIALWACIQVMKQGKSVLYLDEENSLRMQSERLQLMGANVEDVRRHFVYYQSPGLTLSPDVIEDYTATLAEVEPALVVFDSWADFVAIEGLNENDASDMTRWVKQICYPAREQFGAASLILDHVNREDSGRGGRGSSAKLAKLDAAYKITEKAEFDRETMGRLALDEQKDREAFLARNLAFDIGGDGERLVCERDMFAESKKNLDPKGRKVLKAISEFEEGLTFTDWRKETGFNNGTFGRVIKDLQDAGYVVKDNESNKYVRVFGTEQLDIDQTSVPRNAA